jgi:hypothetical protein
MVTSAATSDSIPQESINSFVLPESTEDDGLDWVREAIIYQIFPDRFSRRPGEDGWEQFQEWGASPTLRGFQVLTEPGLNFGKEHMGYLLDNESEPRMRLALKFLMGTIDLVHFNKDHPENVSDVVIEKQPSRNVKMRVMEITLTPPECVVRKYRVATCWEWWTSSSTSRT